MKIKNIFITVFFAGLLAPLASVAANNAVYDKTCALCHASGVAGAPRLGNADDWAPRVAKGAATLYTSALKGTAKGMPPKGGNMALSDAEVKGAVDFMLSKVPGAAKPAKSAAKETPATKVAAKEVPKAEPATVAKAPVASAPVSETVAVKTVPNDRLGTWEPFVKLGIERSDAQFFGSDQIHHGLAILQIVVLHIFNQSSKS